MNVNKISGYHDLEIYKSSYDLAVKVHELSLKLPKYEMFEEGSQLRRSSKGITACIVEGYGRNRYKAEFIKFLVYAHASCDETICHLSFIRDTHEKISEEIPDLLRQYNDLGGKINKFIQYVDKQWNSQPVTRNPQPVTRNSQLVTSPKLATRTS